jgi:hypothetical protein
VEVDDSRSCKQRQPKPGETIKSRDFESSGNALPILELDSPENSLGYASFWRERESQLLRGRITRERVKDPAPHLGERPFGASLFPELELLGIR